MKNFWTLAGFEYKKLLGRKIVWITLASLSIIAVLAICSSIMGNVYTEGEVAESHWSMLKKDKIAAHDFEGRKIDDKMLHELSELEEARSRDIPNELYIFAMKLVQNTTGEFPQGKIFYMSEAELYQMRDTALENVWTQDCLTGEEKAVLRNKNQSLEVPLTYRYAEGYQQIIGMGMGLGMMQCIFIAICIPMIFADEHQRRTAQLILCSKYGKNQLFAAKTFVGVTFSVIGTLTLYITMLIPAALIYGMEGFKTQLQVYYPFLSWNLTMGAALCILLGLGLLAAVIQSVAAMAISDKCRSTTAAMAILVGFMIICSFLNIPGQYRILSQIWSYVPLKLLSVMDVFNNRLISIFANYAGTWQMAPIFYILLSAGGILTAYKVYSGYQANEK